MKVTTTLNAIRKCSPCTEGWTKLLASLNKTKADDEVLELSHILESNGLDDALWCLRAVEGIDKEARLFAVFCARQIQHLNDDPVVKNTIDIAERFAFGEVTKEELRSSYIMSRLAGYEPSYTMDCACNAAHYSSGRAIRTLYMWYVSSSNIDDTTKQVYLDLGDKMLEEQKQKFIEMFC